MPQEAKKGPGLRASVCRLCNARVLWARIKKERGRAGGRAFTPIEIERCEPGTGDIALSSGLFVDDSSAPLAVRVANGTSYREHRPRCSSLAPAAAPRAFSAANFRGPRFGR